MKSFYEWESPWRPNYEVKMAATWMAAAVTTLAIAKYMPVPIPTKFSAIAALACTGMAVYRGAAAWKRHVEVSRLDNYVKEFISIPDLIKKTEVARKRSSVWMGKGFDWTDAEAQKLHALVNQGVMETLGRNMDDKYLDGSYWIHGLDEETDKYIEISSLVGHTLLVGTTRVGKTRMMELLIGQAIIRGEAVIIIDPKGDHALAENARRICEAMGQPERFVYFHPAHPEKSTPIDPMRNWNRRTELASRVAALIPSETGADPFAAFGWKVLNDIVNGLVATGVSPNLVHMKRYIEGGADNLLLNTLRIHFNDNVPDWEARSSSFVKRHKDRVLEAYIDFYKQLAIHEAQSTDLDGLISTFEHNREHFQKMVASLIPILSMLTAEPLTDLLSPRVDIANESERSEVSSLRSKETTDMAKIISRHQVLYLGLDSLADGTVGSAIGSIMLADLTAVAGDRYNYGIDMTPINIFIDEAAEVINQPTIQLMNKGGAANFRVTICTQTFADFAARLGDENKARQVLANTNNKIILRILDAETQQYIADSMPKIKVQSLMLRYGHGVDAKIQDEYQASYQEQMLAEEAEMFPAAMLGNLPPLHYLARLSGGRTIKGRIPILR